MMNVTAVIATGGLRKLRRAYLRRRYRFLFYTLLLTIVAAPVFDAFEFPGALIELFLAANLLAAVMPVSARRGRRVLLALMFVVWLARSATAWFDYPALSAMTLGIWTVIGLLAAALALASPCVQRRLIPRISTRRSAPICSPEFFSESSIGFSNRFGPAPSRFRRFLAHERDVL